MSELVGIKIGAFGFEPEKAAGEMCASCNNPIIGEKRTFISQMGEAENLDIKAGMVICEHCYYLVQREPNQQPE